MEKINADDLKNIKQLGADEVFLNAINLTLFAAGVIAVIAIITAGFMYVIARGDVGEIAKAKMTVVYAVAGMIIVSVAFLITNFILGRF